MEAATRDRLIAGMAVVLYLGVGVLPYSGSTLVVPFPAAVILWAGWLVGAGFVVQLVRRRSMWSLAGAPLALAVWVAYVSLGSLIFGWTA